MPTFTTSTPIDVRIDLPVGSVYIEAAATDTVAVTVEPTNPGKPRDVRAAEEVCVDFADGRLAVISPRPLWRMASMAGPGAATVTIALPAGSNVRGKVSAGSAELTGDLGAVDLKVSAGEARIGNATSMTLDISAGDVSVGRVAGPLSIKGSMGSIRINELVGDGTVKQSLGEVTIGSVEGSLKAVGSLGAIRIGQVTGAITATASSGSIVVDSVRSGVLNLNSSHGSITVGVAEGTAAWLDLDATSGSIRNLLAAAPSPAETDLTAEIHASTPFGDITIRRASSTGA